MGNKKCQCVRCGKTYKLNKDGSFSKWALTHTCTPKNLFSKVKGYFKEDDPTNRLVLIDNNETDKIDDLKEEIQELKSLIKNIKVVSSSPRKPLRAVPGFENRVNKEQKWKEARKGNKKEKIIDPRMAAFGDIITELSESFNKAKGDIKSLLTKAPKEELTKQPSDIDYTAEFRKFKLQKEKEKEKEIDAEKLEVIKE